MIVDLDKSLYVVDENTVEHKIKFINLDSRTVKCFDDSEFAYSTNHLTIIVK